MSLDVYLIEKKEVEDVCCYACGNTSKQVVKEELFHANVTHNLIAMAYAAGIYEHLWRPDELGITHAKELIKPLTEGLDKLTANPEYYKEFNPPKGWGHYDRFVPWVIDYLRACRENPEAKIEVSI